MKIASNFLKHKYAFSIFVIVAAAILSFFVFKIAYGQKIYPGVTLAGIKMSGLTKSQGQKLLEEQIKEFEQKSFVLNYENRIVKTNSAELGFAFDAKASVENAYSLGHKNNLSSDVKDLIGLTAKKGRLAITYDIDNDKLESFLKNNFGEIENKSLNASLKYDGNDFAPTKSKKGTVINRNSLEKQLKDSLGFLKTVNIELSLVEDLPEITDNETDAAYNLTRWIIDDNINLNYNKKSWTPPKDELIEWFVFVPEKEQNSKDNKILGVSIDTVKVSNYLKTLAPEIDQTPVNARLTIGGDGKVKVFSLSQNGQELKLDESAGLISEKLIQGEKKVELIVATSQPDVTTNNIENLGITSLLAKGESNFKGSPKNRRHNIKVGAEKFNGVLVKPGEEFSFNSILGDVDAKQGYLPELVIKNNKTVPEYGGGLCQVSTTIFRAALNAGLPITERKNHAYVVRYYGAPGMDATIYPPHPDFRFKNDTSASVLIQSKIKGDDITFEFYGSSDGREVKLIGPNLYDAQPNGAVKAILYREIYQNNELIKKDTFKSNYASPAKYPRAQFE